MHLANLRRKKCTCSSHTSRAGAYYLSQGQPLSSSGCVGRKQTGSVGVRGRPATVCVCVCVCQHDFPRISSGHPPCDHVGSEAEHEGADEGADLPRRSLPSPPLLLQAALANTGSEGSLLVRNIIKSFFFFSAVKEDHFILSLCFITLFYHFIFFSNVRRRVQTRPTKMFVL